MGNSNGNNVEISIKGDASGVIEAAKQSEAALDTVRKAGAHAAQAFDRQALSAKQMSAAMRQVPMQFTDIFTSLAAGQNPMQVMLQQGGQLKDTFGGIGPAARALGGYVVGLVNPFTVAAAGAAALTLAYHRGSAEADAYTRSLILTGNAAGQTAAQLEAAAHRTAVSTGGTQGAAAEALALSVAAGVPVAAQDAVAAAAVRMEQTMSRAIGDTVAEFEKLGRAPVAASLKLNEQYNYLTAATYRQIKALDDQGRSGDAAALAMKAYADAINDRTGQITQNLGFIEDRWLGLKAAAKGALDAVLDIGRAGDPLAAAVERVQDIQAKIKDASKPGNVAYDPAGSRAELIRLNELLAAARANMVAVRDKVNADGAAATAKAKANLQEKAGIDLSKEADKFATRQVQMKRELAKVEELYAASAKTAADADARRAAIAGIRDKFTEKRTPRAGPDGLDDAAREQAKYYSQQYEAVAKLARGVEAEAAAGEKLLPVERALAEARATLSAAQVREIEQAASGALLIERRTQAEKESAAAATIYTESIKRQITPIDEHIQQLVTERERAGQTEAEINALALARVLEAHAIAAANGARQEHLDFYEREIAARQGLGAELEKQKVAQADWAVGAVRGLRAYASESEKAADAMANAFKRGAQMAEDAIANFVVTGKLDIASLARYAATELAREQLAKPLVKAGTDWLSGLFSGFGGGGGFYPFGGSLLDVGNMSANGNAFDRSGVMAFADGGVVTRPTLFPFAKGTGLMGEAGPEAIMPLTRGANGKLGVQATSAGASAPQSIRVELINSGTPQKATSVQPSFNLKGMVLSIFTEDIAQGGPAAARMESTYGLNRAAGAY